MLLSIKVDKGEKGRPAGRATAANHAALDAWTRLRDLWTARKDGTPLILIGDIRDGSILSTYLSSVLGPSHLARSRRDY